MECEKDYSFVRVHMAPDEHILWKGNPSVRPLLAKNDYFTVFFGAVWCFVPLKMIISILQEGDVAGSLPVALFVAVGFSLMIGRPFYNAFMRTRTQYVITNRKIIRKRGKRIDFLAASTMPSAHCEVHADGSGTIYFGQRMQSSKYNSNSVVFVLENVQNVAQVQSAIDRMER